MARARRNKSGRFTRSRRSTGGGGSSSTRSSGGGGRSGPSPKAIKEKVRTTAIATGSLAALGFGYLQNKVALPSISGVPNSLSYGAVTLIAGVFMGSDLLMNAAQGPLYAGLHALGKTGFSLPQAAQIAGDDRGPGLFPEVAGDFDDIVTPSRAA